jgi:hypothetical protein
VVIGLHVGAEAPDPPRLGGSQHRVQQDAAEAPALQPSSTTKATSAVSGSSEGS